MVLICIVVIAYLHYVTYQVPGLTLPLHNGGSFFSLMMSCKSVQPDRFRLTTIQCNLYPCPQKSGSATEQPVMINLTLLKIHDSHGYTFGWPRIRFNASSVYESRFMIHKQKQERNTIRLTIQHQPPDPKCRLKITQQPDSLTFSELLSIWELIQHF